MHRILTLPLLLAAVASPSGPTHAQALTVTGGTIANLFADPSDVVVELSKAGSCGSKYFHIQRAATNFRELTSVALTAFTGGRVMTFFVKGCFADRNVVSHGFASNPP